VVISTQEKVIPPMTLSLNRNKNVPLCFFFRRDFSLPLFTKPMMRLQCKQKKVFHQTGNVSHDFSLNPDWTKTYPSLHRSSRYVFTNTKMPSIHTQKVSGVFSWNKRMWKRSSNAICSIFINNNRRIGSSFCACVKN